MARKQGVLVCSRWPLCCAYSLSAGLVIAPWQMQRNATKVLFAPGWVLPELTLHAFVLEIICVHVVCSMLASEWQSSVPLLNVISALCGSQSADQGLAYHKTGVVCRAMQACSVVLAGLLPW